MTPDLASCFEERRRQLHDLARAIVGTRADADDVLQDAWLKAAGSTNEAIRSPAAWVTTMVRNVALDQRRHRLVAERFASQDLEVRHERSVEDTLIERMEAAAMVRRIVELLDPADAAALLLREAFDEDPQALAKRAGRSVGAMRVALHRARKRVRGPDRRPRDVDPQETDRTFVVCWQALTLRDPTPLYAALAAAAPPAATLQGDAVPPVRIGCAQIDGRTVLALRQGGRLICVVPIGVPSEAFACVDA